MSYSLGKVAEADDTLQKLQSYTPCHEQGILFAANHPVALCAAVLQRVLGLQISWHHADRIPKERHVLVSNHLTAGDLMMLYSLPQHYVHLISAKLPKRISQARSRQHVTSLVCNSCLVKHTMILP